MTKPTKPEIRINVRVPIAEKVALREVATLSGITETMIVRHAIKKTLSEIRKQVEAGQGVAIVL